MKRVFPFFLLLYFGAESVLKAQSFKEQSEIGLGYHLYGFSNDISLNYLWSGKQMTSILGITYQLSETPTGTLIAQRPIQRFGLKAFSGYNFRFAYHDLIFTPGIQLTYRHGHFFRNGTQNWLITEAVGQCRYPWRFFTGYAQLGFGPHWQWGDTYTIDEENGAVVRDRISTSHVPEFSIAVGISIPLSPRTEE